ncbi:MAG: M14 family zinc carboxypeptidase [Acidimicrobiales bacterium]
MPASSNRDPHLISRRRLIQGSLATAAGLAGRAALPGAAQASLLGGGGPFRLAVVRPQTATDWAALSGFDLTHAGRDGGIEVLVWPVDHVRLAASGIAHEIVIDDLVAHDVEQAQSIRATAMSGAAAQPGQRANYRTVAEHVGDLAALVAARPDLARTLTLPERTLDGQHVAGIEIAGAVARPDGRPTFYVDGLHHAREWPAGELSTMFAHDLVEGYGTDARITGLLDRCRVVVVPVVNPDGFGYSRSFPLDDPLLELPFGALGQGSYWRKNRRALTTDLGLGQLLGLTSYGVDPNRNYGFRWGGPGASPVLVAQDYRGPSPFSEVEPRNVRWALLSRGVTAVITNHTYSDLVLRPWGDTDADSPDEPLLRQLGDAMAAINGYTSQKSIALYPTTGTTEDYSYAALGALGYTFEHGQSFHPPYGSYVPDAYARNREAFLLLFEAAADPAHHSVIRGRTVNGAGVGTSGPVEVRKQIALPAANGSVVDMVRLTVTSEPDGRFEVHVGPSTAPLSPVQEAFDVATAGAVAQAAVGRGEAVDVGDLAL